MKYTWEDGVEHEKSEDLINEEVFLISQLVTVGQSNEMKERLWHSTKYLRIVVSWEYFRGRVFSTENWKKTLKGRLVPKTECSSVIILMLNNTKEPPLILE